MLVYSWAVKGFLYGWLSKYGPFLDPCDNTAPNIQGTAKDKGIIVLTAAHLVAEGVDFRHGIMVQVFVVWRFGF